MSNWKAVRVGLNSRLKSLTGVIYRSRVQQARSFSEEQFWSYQKQAFLTFYRRARLSSPYYRSLHELYPDIREEGGHVLELLEMLPILPKSVVKQRNSAFWSSPKPPFTRFHTTSGTTGAPLVIPATLTEKGITQAVLDEWYQQICGRRNPRALFLSGYMVPRKETELYWHDPLSKQLYLSIFSLHPKYRADIVHLLEKLRPSLIYGFSSAVYQLASLLEDSLGTWKEEPAIICTSEVLHPYWRQQIERTLGKRVFDLYGAQEGTHAVMECSAGRMHIHPLIGIVEILNEHNRTAAKGEVGRIVVTGFTRHSMPLIRYDIGDMAESTGYHTDCPCGLGWPTIGRLEGRVEDLIKTRDGRRFGMTAMLVKDTKGIKESQIIQIAYEKFVVNIVPKEDEPVERAQLEAFIRQKLEQRIQTCLDIEFRYVPSIPRTPGGKWKNVVVTF